MSTHHPGSHGDEVIHPWLYFLDRKLTTDGMGPAILAYIDDANPKADKPPDTDEYFHTTLDDYVSDQPTLRFLVEHNMIFWDGILSAITRSIVKIAS